MPRKSDTREKVFSAADTLLQEGKRPTQQNIRELIGTGSITTINSALNEWWSTLSDRISRQQAHPELPEPVINAANQLWDQALAYAQHSFKSERDHLEALIKERRADSEEEAIKLRASLDDLQQLNTQLSKRNLELNQSALEINQNLAETEKQLIQSTAYINDLERELKQLKLIQNGNATIESFVGSASNSTKTEADELLELKVDNQVKSKEIKELKTSIKLKEEEIERLNKQLREQEKLSIQQKHHLELVVAQQDARYESTLSALNDCKKSLSLASSKHKGNS